jgi:hypothetical protein
MDHGYLVMHPDNTVHEWFCLGTPAGATCFRHSREEAESWVAESRKTIEAMRSGVAAPDDKQIVWELQEVTKAVLAYAKDHGGALPTDLGASLPYVATDNKQLSTPAQRAAIYMSPPARRGVAIPEKPTAEWVNRNTTYTYLGGPGLNLARIAFPAHTVIIHDDLRRGDRYQTQRGEVSLIPFARLRGDVERQEPKFVEEAVASSKATIDVARNGGTLPDLPQAIQDTHIIAEAARAYAKAHDDAMPPDLGATLAYLDPASLFADTAAERAKVYLSPAAERAATLPTEITPEWINGHSNYVYLGDTGLSRKEFAKATNGMVVVHSPLNEEMHMLSAYGTDSWIAIGDISGRSHPWPLTQFHEQFDEMIKELAERRAAGVAR